MRLMLTKGLTESAVSYALTPMPNQRQLKGEVLPALGFLEGTAYEDAERLET